MATLVSLVYQPGFAGHMLTYLLSLDSKTFFHKPDSINVSDTLENRVQTYSFNNAKKFNHWYNWHRKYNILEPYQIVDLTKDTDLTVIVPMHPQDFYSYAVGPDFDNKLISKYLIADLPHNSWCDYWLVETKKLWYNFPPLRHDEFTKEEYIRQHFDCFGLAVDKFLEPSTWLEEYHRACDFLKLSTHDEQATILYNTWYETRVIDLKQKFKLLSSKTKDIYSSARLALERNETVQIDNVVLGNNEKI